MSQPINLPQTLEECHALIAVLAEQIGQLQERLKLDSNNSSKPPSSNGPGQGKRQSRRASKRKRGAQLGHQGSARALLDEGEVGKIIDCKPVEVCECGAGVAMLADEPVRHQVFDVPVVQPQVHEYRRSSSFNFLPQLSVFAPIQGVFSFKYPHSIFLRHRKNLFFQNCSKSAKVFSKSSDNF